MWSKATRASLRSVFFSFMFAKEEKIKNNKKKISASALTGSELLSRRDEISDSSVHFNALEEAFSTALACRLLEVSASVHSWLLGALFASSWAGILLPLLPSKEKNGWQKFRAEEGMQKAADGTESQAQENICRDLCYLYCKMHREIKLHRNLFPGKCGGNIPPFKAMPRSCTLQSQNCREAENSCRWGDRGEHFPAPALLCPHPRALPAFGDRFLCWRKMFPPQLPGKQQQQSRVTPAWAFGIIWVNSGFCMRC